MIPTNKKITLPELAALATKCGYNLATLQAVIRIEAPNGGFLPDGRCTILFERHWFYKLSPLPISKTRPDLSNPLPGGYLGGTHEWDRLDAAMALDRHNALQSASWGKGQIMGFNHVDAGYPTVEAMVADFSISEINQVKGMCHFIASNPTLRAIMQKPHPTLADFTTFALHYNGKGYAKNAYHIKLYAAYQSLNTH